MKIKDYKCKCGHDDFFFANKGNQTGIYCSYCGKWLKWADRDEQNLRMKQASVLDKIRAEIEPTRKMYLEMNDIDWLNGCDYVLSVIDKYKAESGGQA